MHTSPYDWETDEDFRTSDYVKSAGIVYLGFFAMVAVVALINKFGEKILHMRGR